MSVRALRPRQLPTPQTEPPYDEHPTRTGPAGGPVQGTLALRFAAGVPAAPVAALRLVPAGSPQADSAELPDPTAWATRMARAVAEVLSGERPAAQLLPWCVPDVYARLERRGAIVADAPGPRHRAVLRRVSVCRPAPDAIEVSTVLHGQGRARALAFRLDGQHGRWICTALELG